MLSRQPGRKRVRCALSYCLVSISRSIRAAMPQPSLEHKRTPRSAIGLNAVRLGVLMASGALLLGGCSPHKDAVDGTLSWVQHMRGGVIASQRPPPPGIYDPYPHVGLTPTQAPEMPSPQDRALVTQGLIRERNLAYRTVAANGSIIPNIPPPPSATAQPPAKAAPSAASSPQQNGAAQDGSQQASLPEGVSGAIMDAADSSPNQNTQNAASPTGKASSTDSHANKAQDKTAEAEPEVGMPAVRPKAAQTEIPASDIPQIPDGPPTAPSFPGFDVPSDAHVPDTIKPNYDLVDVKGTSFHFVPQSDVLSSGQENTLSKLKADHPNGPFFIRGFGNALSLSAQDQSDAVKLGILRAQRLATALVNLGVPSSSIHVRGDAFGTGAKVATSP
ncbi:hypothetical protein ACJRO0_08580 [Acetobacter oryzifermentans]|uniref:hypothetical protein n=1 Tax=Acetobacter TaxID=434 RepID=UPI001239770A|nr:hypothetical protein FKW31_11820 [Acetobacter sp. DmW_136]